MIILKMIWVGNLLGIIFGEKSAQSQIHTQPVTSPDSLGLPALAAGEFCVILRKESNLIMDKRLQSKTTRE
jgi:hypothetical protein